MAKPNKTIIARMYKIQQEIDKVKPLYQELDSLVVEVAKLLGPGAWELPGFKIEVKDNFIEKNVCFRPAAVRRFEVIIETTIKNEKV